MNRVKDVVEKWRIGDNLFTRKYLSTQYKTKRTRYGTLLLRCKRTGFTITASRYDAKRGQREA